MEHVLAELAESVAAADDLEGLTRSLLELLEKVTGLESTYLTRIDMAQGVQRILFSRNSRQLQIPEGLEVPWGDTLCKRALEESRPYTSDVDACWGDSDAARQLGIRTYVSQPVRTLDGNLYGTLCAASAASTALSDSALGVLSLFARLIGHQVDRELHLQALRRDNAMLASRALTDPLTGIPNRRALMDELERMLGRARRSRSSVLVAFIDLDGFKGINDRHGHDIGDRFLVEVTRRLAACIRSGDLLARYGGDEFVVIAPGDGAEDLRRRLEAALVFPFEHLETRFDHAGASVGVVVSPPNEADAGRLLAWADTAMYEIKRLRRQRRAGTATP